MHNYKATCYEITSEGLDRVVIPFKSEETKPERVKLDFYAEMSQERREIEALITITKVEEK